MIYESPAYGQIMPQELPSPPVDANGVELNSARLRLNMPLVEFGDGLGPNVQLDAKYPLWSFSYGSCCDERMMIMAGTEIFNKKYYGSNTGQEMASDMIAGNLAIWITGNFNETSTGTGYNYKKPAAGVFSVPFYNGPYSPSRQHMGYIDKYGNWLDNTVFVNQPTYLVWTYRLANGEIRKYRYEKSSIGGGRLANVSTNRGVFIQYEYERTSAPTNSTQVKAWGTPTRISGGSLAYIYCDPNTNAVCSAVAGENNFVNISYADGALIEKSSGEKKKYKLLANGNMEITAPGTNELVTASKKISLECNNDEFITSVSSGGTTWSYDYTCGFDPETATSAWSLVRTDPNGGALRMWSGDYGGVPGEYTDELGQLHQFLGEKEKGYVARWSPSAMREYVTRDNRNNVVEAGTYAPDQINKIVSYTAGYPATCGNFKTCNQPTWTRDGNGNQTDYTYDAAHGGILTETGPGDASGVRPQKRYEYAQRYAWLKNSGGTYSQAADPVWVRTKEEYCVSTAAVSGDCAGGASDEVVTTYDYGPNSGPNMLLVRGVAVTSNGQTLRTCYGYDRMGRKISETKPAADLSSCP